MYCLSDKKKCNCGAEFKNIRVTAKAPADSAIWGKNSTIRKTIGKNGNAFITIHQQDAFGRTTIIREIKKEKFGSFGAMAGNGSMVGSDLKMVEGAKGSVKMIEGTKDLKMTKTNLVVSEGVKDAMSEIGSLGRLFFSQLFSSK